MPNSTWIMLEAEWLFVLREETIFCHTYIHTYIFPIFLFISRSVWGPMSKKDLDNFIYYYIRTLFIQIKQRLQFWWVPCIAFKWNNQFSCSSCIDKSNPSLERKRILWLSLPLPLLSFKSDDQVTNTLKSRNGESMTSSTNRFLVLFDHHTAVSMQTVRTWRRYCSICISSRYILIYLYKVGLHWIIKLQHYILE